VLLHATCLLSSDRIFFAHRRLSGRLPGPYQIPFYDSSLVGGRKLWTTRNPSQSYCISFDEHRMIRMWEEGGKGGIRLVINTVDQQKLALRPIQGYLAKKNQILRSTPAENKLWNASQWGARAALPRPNIPSATQQYLKYSKRVPQSEPSAGLCNVIGSTSVLF